MKTSITFPLLVLFVDRAVPMLAVARTKIVTGGASPFSDTDGSAVTSAPEPPVFERDAYQYYLFTPSSGKISTL